MVFTDPEACIGLTLGSKYELCRVLGRGGMGVVFEAVHSVTSRRFAVKVMTVPNANDEAKQRFRREAQAAARIEHPSVVSVFDVAIDPALGMFIVMELLHGEPLDEYLAQNQRLSFAETCAILTPVMEALELAHEAGVVHRDLKPSNVFLHVDARGQRIPKLVDFGIAIMEGPRFTETGNMAGTAGYMAPEQMRNMKAADRRSDVFALGAMIYECLSGSLPYGGSTSVERLMNVMSGTLVPLDTMAPETPRHAVDAIHRALRQDPKERPASVLEFARALVAAPNGDAAVRAIAPTILLSEPPLHALSAPAVALAPAPSPAPSRTARKLGAPAVAVGGVVLAGGATILAFAWHRGALGILPDGRASASNVPLAAMTPLALPGLEFRRIEGGTASLGSTLEESQAARTQCLDEGRGDPCAASQFDRELPPITFEVRAFHLTRHEVTNGELFAWITNQHGLAVERSSDGTWIGDASGRLFAVMTEVTRQAGLALEEGRLVIRDGFAARPAVWVSHRLATRFCRDVGGRLPTSNEWEWAARGAERRRFSWGNAQFVCSRAVAAQKDGLDCGDAQPAPALVTDPTQDETPAGVLGLSGNVAEWVRDAMPGTWGDSASCGADGCFVVRGGDWASPHWLTRVATRRSAPASPGTEWIGWRCASDVR
jgi:serine/threonine-protein kinase